MRTKHGRAHLQSPTTRKRTSKRELLALKDVDPEALRRLLIDTFLDPAYTPPRLPQVAMEIMELAGRRDASLRDAHRILSNDPLLAGRVVRIANSAAYRPARASASLDDCVTRLGLNGVRDIVLQEAMMGRVFRAPGFTELMEHLRDHSLATAHVCGIISRITKLQHGEAFLLGLLHDVGLAGSLSALSESYAAVEPQELALACQVLHDEHEQAGRIMCGLWRMPRNVTEAIGNHHAWSRAEAPSIERALIVVADAVVSELGCPAFPVALRMPALPVPDRQDPQAVDAARRVLGFDTRLWGLLHQHARDVIEQLGE